MTVDDRAAGIVLRGMYGILAAMGIWWAVQFEGVLIGLMIVASVMAAIYLGSD